MKVKIAFQVVVAAMFALCQLPALAQGVIVYKNDGTKIKVPYTLLDSIATYTYEEEIPGEPGEDSVSVKTFTVKGVSFKMVYVDGGTFEMGASGGGNALPVHSVTLSDYYIGETEVTQELWQAVMGSNPSSFTGNQRPVEQVSWNDCQEFIEKLNTLTGEKFRLPTEAEWEYAARGGNKSKGYIYSGSNDVDAVAWHRDNSESSTHEVKGKLPNELGLYDMSGNVWEWCSDWYGAYSSGAQVDPAGPASGSCRVLRGGSWSNFVTSHPVFYRSYSTPSFTNNYRGVRFVLPSVSQ